MSGDTPLEQRMLACFVFNDPCRNDCNVRSTLENMLALLTKEVKAAREQVAKELAAPYPEDIFTPFTANEMGKLMLIWEQSDKIVPNFGTRLHANLARQWAKNLLEAK